MAIISKYCKLLQFLCQFFFSLFYVHLFLILKWKQLCRWKNQAQKIYNLKNWKDKSLCQSLMGRECRWLTTLHDNRHWNVTYSSTAATTASISNRKHVSFGGFVVLTGNHLECFSCAIYSLGDLSFKYTVFLQDTTVVEFSNGFVVVRQVYEFVN